MKLHRSILLLLALAISLAACQAGPAKQPGTGSSETTTANIEPGSNTEILTPTEEDIIQAFEHEVDERWLEAAVL